MDRVITSVIASLITAGVLYLVGLTPKILVPANAVLAFDNPKCPTGWDPLPAAQGRFVIGAGANGAEEYKVGQQGGADKVKLEIANLPSHSHAAVKPDTMGAGGGDRNFAHPLPSSLNKEPVQTGKEGGDQPFSIMPPWYALTYCRKTG